MKIRTRIIITIFVSLIVPVILAGIVTDWHFYENIKEGQDARTSFTELFFDNVYMSTTLVGELKEAEAEGLTETSIISRMEAFSREHLTEAYGYVISKDGQTIFETENITNHEEYGYSEEIDEMEVVYYDTTVASFLYQDGSHGQVVLVMDIDQVMTDMFIYWGIFVLLSFGLFIVTLVGLMVWINRGINRPLKALKASTAAITMGDLDQPLNLSKSKDFKPLAEEIDVLRGSLKASLKVQEELEEEKARILGNISHDIRTPLTAISGYATGLKDGIAKDEATRNEYLSVIESKVKVIEKLVGNLKTLVDMENTEMSYDMVTFDLGDFLTDCVEELKYDVDGVGGKLVSRIAEGDFSFTGDPEQLRRVFMNLVSNAIKYRSEAPLEVTITLTSNGGRYYITVEDNGIGIPKNQIGHVMKRFYRVDHSRNQKIPGSGLGLSICQEVVEGHGGTLIPYYKRLGTIMEIVLPIDGGQHA